MDNIFLVERLNSVRCEMTLFWSAFFIIGGGSITLFFSSQSILAHILCAFGIFFSVVMLNAYTIRRKEMIKTLNLLENKNG